MNVPFLDLKAGMRTIRHDVDAGVAAVFEKCDFVLGEAVARLERDVAGYCSAPHAVGVASGTDALKVALKALGAGPGHAVITSPVTFIATAEAINSLGARPIFCDIDPVTYNISPAAIRRFIDEECEKEDGGLRHRASNCRVSGIIPVHLFGQCADMSAILDIAAEHGLYVVEDACQAFGASFSIEGEHRMAGAMGNASAFSFYPSKNLGGAGDGGMIVMSDAGLARQCRTLRVHGAARAYEHDEQGFNSRLDTLQAVVVGVKLPHVDAWVRARRQKAAAYVRMFQQAAKKSGVNAIFTQNLTGAELPAGKTIALPAEAENCHHSYNVFSIRVHERDLLVDFLRSREIGTHIYYPIPLHVQKVFSFLGYKPGDFPVTEEVCRTVLALPMYPELPEEHQQFVVENVCAFVSGVQ